MAAAVSISSLLSDTGVGGRGQRTSEAGLGAAYLWLVRQEMPKDLNLYMSSLIEILLGMYSGVQKCLILFGILFGVYSGVQKYRQIHTMSCNSSRLCDDTDAHTDIILWTAAG